MTDTTAAQHFSNTKAAPEAKKDTKPKMGLFLHFIMAYWFLRLGLVLVVMGFATKKMIDPLDPSNISIFIETAIDAIALWLTGSRKAIARPIVILIELANIALSVYSQVYDSSLTLFNLCLYIIPSAIVIAYFAFAPRAKAIFVEHFNTQSRAALLERADGFYAPKTWPYWRNIIAYFCIFSVMGHWMEAGFCLLIKYGILDGIYDPNSQIWSDWLYPFCVYGVGACFCAVVFYPIKMFLVRHIKHPVVTLVISFAISAFICTCIEFTMGMIMNQPVNGVYPLWDYSTMPFNFMGQVCLQNAIGFGVAATVVTWIVYPALETVSARLPRDVNNGIFVVIVTVFLILFFLYCQQFIMPGLDFTS